MSTPVYLHRSTSFDHLTGLYHPECPERIEAIETALAQRNWLGMNTVVAPIIERDLLEAVHPREHVLAIEALCQQGGGSIDADTVVSAGSYCAALHAAGGAARLVELLLSGSAPWGFAGLRPPGHHAESDRAMGFCLFNSVALAARRALQDPAVKRVMVFDWDVHHGNGTNNIFHASPEVLYVSIHQAPLYPGTGQASDQGSGAGQGYTVNLPVPAGSDDLVWCSLVDHLVVPLGRLYRPDLILISAGYDAHRDDPLASCLVTERGFAAMAAAVSELCGELGVPLGLVLEGGYNLTALSASLVATVEAVSTTFQTGWGVASTPKTSLVIEAQERVKNYWQIP